MDRIARMQLVVVVAVAVAALLALLKVHPFPSYTHLVTEHYLGT